VDCLTPVAQLLGATPRLLRAAVSSGSKRERGGAWCPPLSSARSARHHESMTWPPGRSGASDRACSAANPASSSRPVGDLGLGQQDAALGEVRGEGDRDARRSQRLLQQAELDQRRGSEPVGPLRPARCSAARSAAARASWGWPTLAGRQARAGRGLGVARVPQVASCDGAARSRPPGRFCLPSKGIGPEQLGRRDGLALGLRRPSVPASGELVAAHDARRSSYARPRWRTWRSCGPRRTRDACSATPPGAPRSKSPGWIGGSSHAGGSPQGGFRRRTRRAGGGRRRRTPRSVRRAAAGRPTRAAGPAGWYRRMDSRAGGSGGRTSSVRSKRPGRRKGRVRCPTADSSPRTKTPSLSLPAAVELVRQLHDDVAAGGALEVAAFEAEGVDLVEEQHAGGLPAGGLEDLVRLRSLWPSHMSSTSWRPMPKKRAPSSPAHGPGKEGLSAPGGPYEQQAARSDLPYILRELGLRMGPRKEVLRRASPRRGPRRRQA